MPRKKKEEQKKEKVEKKVPEETSADAKRTRRKTKEKEKERPVAPHGEASAPETISWRAAEYEHGDKSLSWQFSVGGATVFLAAVGIWMENFFFSLFIVFAGGLVFFFSRRKPETLDFEISERGVEIRGKTLLSYEKIKNFSMRERPGMLDELIIRKDVTVNPYVRIPVDSKTGERAVAFLKDRIPEAKYDASIMDLVSDWLGL